MECGVTELQSQGQDKMEIVLAKDGKQLKKTDGNHRPEKLSKQQRYDLTMKYTFEDGIILP